MGLSPPCFQAEPTRTFPPPLFLSLHFFVPFCVFFFANFSPFLPFLTPKLRKKAENCESFAAFHTCSTQNAEFVNRHNSSGKTKNKQNAARPRQYSPFPPQKRRFLAQNHVAGTHAQTQNLQFFTSTIVFLSFFLYKSSSLRAPGHHRDTRLQVSPRNQH